MIYCRLLSKESMIRWILARLVSIKCFGYVSFCTIIQSSPKWETSELNLLFHIFTHCSPVHVEKISGVIVLIDFEKLHRSEPLPGQLFYIKVKCNENILNISIFYGPQWRILPNLVTFHIFFSFSSCSVYNFLNSQTCESTFLIHISSNHPT